MNKLKVAIVSFEVQVGITGGGGDRGSSSGERWLSQYIWQLESSGTKSSELLGGRG